MTKPPSCPAPPSGLSNFFSIYKGWLPTVLKVSSAQATRFGVFQVLKSSPWYGKDSTAKSAAAGAAAGATSVFLFQVRDLCTFFSRCMGIPVGAFLRPQSPQRDTMYFNGRTRFPGARLGSFRSILVVRSRRVQGWR